ncbi:gluconokinase [Lacticaseibacillus thailandensis]|uniref:gluconokinase n=1 Tax=Lacticaseibacillus thailandensis TaxID=381741 RepID=UPI00138EE844|nr:gluconokinase [Lacticaseibacillus thailandensis]
MRDYRSPRRCIAPVGGRPPATVDTIDDLADTRARGAVATIQRTIASTDFFAHVPIPAHPMTPLAKLMWLHHRRPDLLQQAHYVLGIKEYILARLTGQLVEDYSIASATGLMDVRSLSWYPAALSLAGVRLDQLPPLVDTGYQLHGLTPAAVQATGLSPQVTVVVGASDGVLSNLGLGAINPGAAAINIGTSGAVRVMTDRPLVAPHHDLFTYYLAPHQWVVGGATSNGGNVLQWLQTALFPQLPGAAAQVGSTSTATLLRALANIPAGAAGLLFVPYLHGARAPLWDANARAAFHGLNAEHSRLHMARAALEGVAYNLKRVLATVINVTGPVTTVAAAGGFARSPLWCGILASVLDGPLAIPQGVDSSARGAAMLGLRSLGVTTQPLIDNLQQHFQMVPPQSADVAVYAQLYPLWCQLVDQTRAVDDQLATFQTLHAGKAGAGDYHGQ